MIIINDFSHTSMRMLFRSINEVMKSRHLTLEKDEVTGKYVTSSFIQVYKSLLFNSLKSLLSRFAGARHILVIDGRPNWRVKYQTGYKLNRVKGRKESPINFETFFEETDKILEDIEKFFPFEVLRVPKCEADDIAMIIGDYIDNEEVVLVTADHDWSQLLAWKDNVKIWDPIKYEFTEISDYEKEIIETESLGKIPRFSLVHALIGDKGDDVPKVNDGTVFSDNFKKYLKDKIFSKDDIQPLKAGSITAIRFKQFIEPFENLKKEDLKSLIEPFYKKVVKGIKTKPEYFVLLKDEIKKDLFDNYNIFQKVTKGKDKGKDKDIKDIFKNVPLGKKKALEIAKSNFTLENYLNSHPMYRENLISNNQMVNFKMIPEDIKKDCIKRYEELVNNYNLDTIKHYFLKNNLNIDSRGFFNPLLETTHIENQYEPTPDNWWEN